MHFVPLCLQKSDTFELRLCITPVTSLDEALWLFCVVPQYAILSADFLKLLVAHALSQSNTIYATICLIFINWPLHRGNLTNLSNLIAIAAEKAAGYYLT